MRVLYFSRDYTPHDHRFLAALAQTEHQVYYLRLEKRGHAQEDRMLPPGVTPVIWKGGQKPYSLRARGALQVSLRKALREIKPDVVHAGPIPTCAWLVARTGFHPLVSMSWGSDLLLEVDQDRRARRAAQYALKRTAVFLGDCDAVRQKAIQMGFPADRIVTFPWGVDLAHFSLEGGDGGLRERAGWQDEFVLLHTRSWETVYGVEVLALAFAAAARQRPELRLFLLGNGSLAGEIRRILMPVMGQVQFVGQVNQEKLPHYYRAADLYVSASHSDGSSVSLMEALACGLPALVSDIPGNREWVAEGEQGWLFPDGDSHALAQAILRAAERRPELSRYSQRARQLAEERADWPKNFEKCLEAYALAVRQA